MFHLEEELKNLPSKPGVYLMHDQADTVIYVGKAINLKNRVRSYFREKVGRGPWIDKMIRQIVKFEYIVTHSDLEALVLENNLIKEYNPKYNTLLKDGKTYPFIKVTVQEAFPRVLFSRELKKDKAKYFGPYPNSTAVKNTIELINKLFKVRTCNRVLPRDIKKERPCLNYHIKQCDAPCQGYVSKEAYGEQMREALEFLNGNYQSVLKDLEQKMQMASQEMEFEEAANYRDLIAGVTQIAQRQKITDSDQEDKDIVAVAKEDDDAVVQVFFVRGGKMIGREHFYMEHIEGLDVEEIIQEFLKQFYGGTPFIPREIMIQSEIVEHELLSLWLSELRGGKVYIRIPKKGKKEKLVDLAVENAKMILRQDKEKIKREEGRTIGAVKQLASSIGMEQIHRMEAFDISNINGFENVGSMVVYEKGKPKKSDYRKFRIKSVQGPDDYACMKEVLTRRFRHGLEEQKTVETNLGSFTRFPDLLLMDGGKGQVNIALEVLRELEIDIPVCGMVKDDTHSTRGLYFNNQEIPMDKHSEAFRLITRIQDEAHRFAIEYHRSLRSKTQVRSVLDEIEGIGSVRRKALMKHFDSIQDIKDASVEALMEVDGIPRNIAENIFSFFHK